MVAKIDDISIPTDAGMIKGVINHSQQSKGIILFAHGSGSGRLSPRNQLVASVLQEAGFATLLMDLLTDKEEIEDDRTGELRFNIPFLSDRLMEVAQWVYHEKELKKLACGFFGASTGAAAAIVAATKIPEQIRAIVSRGGRPDLAGHHLKSLSVPTLLIVGGNDYGVIELNQEAYDVLSCEKRLELIPGATHLFEEPGTLIQAAHLAASWFLHHF